MDESPKSFNNGSSATKLISHYDMENAQRLSPRRVMDFVNKGKIPNIHNNRSTAQSQMEFVKND